MFNMSDTLTPSQRSYCMSRVKNKDTDIEVLVRSELFKRGLRFRKNVKELPGTPDIVFPKAKIAVFIDGDFWHGYRFSAWKHTVSDFWKKKISTNRERDQRNFKKLRKMGWKVIRIWQHEIKKDIDSSIEKIIAALNSRKYR